jgi:hypothetical protein
MRRRRPPPEDPPNEENEDIDAMPEDNYSQGRLITRLEERVRDHERRINRLEDSAITQAQFGPVEKLVYGLAVAMLMAVVGALLRVVVAS